MKTLPMYPLPIMRAGVVIAGLLSCALASAQELVFSSGTDPSGAGPLVVIPDLGNPVVGEILGNATPIYITPTQPHLINPHGFALLGPTTAVTGKIPTLQTGPFFFVQVIDITTASLIAEFNPGGVNEFSYSGYGTVAVNPSGSHVLLAGGSPSGGANATKLFVVPTPLSNLSVASDILILPGHFGTAQTHAIAFDPTTGRAYVAHSSGITAIDPPYNAANVAFTMALPDLGSNIVGRPVALSRLC